MMEFKVLKCLIENDYDEILKQFGIDKNKAAFEAERYLGRKSQCLRSPNSVPGIVGSRISPRLGSSKSVDAIIGWSFPAK
jgi:hypothetical protein